MSQPVRPRQPIGPLALDATLIGVAHVAAFLIMGRPPINYLGWLAATVLLILVSLGISLFRGAHRMQARHLGRVDLVNLGVTSLLVAIAAALLQMVLRVGFDEIHMARIPLATGAFTFMLLVTVRIAQGREPHLPGAENPANTLIVGAGDAGVLIYHEISRAPGSRYKVVGFVDDDVRKVSTTINGMPVVGTVDDVPRLVEQLGIEEILIAIPSASGEINRRIFHICSQTGARVQNLPSIAIRVFSEKPMVPLMREFQVEDLLRRAPIQADLSKARAFLGGERVLVTGGGGSIGSELARQVAALNPSQLILLGKGENSIFEIDRELREGKIIRSVPVICDVRDPQGLDLAMKEHKPRVVFHAAAHKHVPLMEANPIEAVRNNVFGTLNVAEACVRHGVGKFILVSTDKAVNPGNVMGASKRVAEMIVQALAGRSETGFAIVRFGNVLGSRGSLIPILRSQIDKGGPVTVTDPQMTRYFMTIPEAAQLIVQAGAFGGEGEVFILDMGEPVRILELAEDLIRMHGMRPGQDIPIEITGARPGEKIHEELFYEDEALEAMEDPRIRRVLSTERIAWPALRQALDDLARLCDEGDQDKVRTALLELSWGRSLPPVALD